MSLFVLDTDTITLYQHGQVAVCTNVETRPADKIVITVLSVEEQLSGWYALLRQAKTPRQQSEAYAKLARSIPILARWPILSFDESAIHRFRGLRSMKLNVGMMDLSIAAIALEHAGIVVTRNLRDFRRVPGLQVEDGSC